MSAQAHRNRMLDVSGQPHAHQNGCHFEFSPSDPEYALAYCNDCRNRVYFEEADW